jgi:hypothetical protein
METITEQELLQEIYNYIRDTYDFEICDNFGDELQFTLENKKHINISINIDKE